MLNTDLIKEWTVVQKEISGEKAIRLNLEYAENPSYKLEIMVNETMNVELKYRWCNNSDMIILFQQEKEISELTDGLEKILASILEACSYTIKKRKATFIKFVDILKQFTPTFQEDKRYISWETYVNKSRLLAERLRREKADLIVAIGRGGFPLGTIVSHHLDIPLAGIITSSYKNQNREDLHIGDLSLPKIDLVNKIVIVDDIADSGVTLENVVELLHSSYPAADIVVGVMHMREDTPFKPNYFIDVIPKGLWIVYPYER